MCVEEIDNATNKFKEAKRKAATGGEEDKANLAKAKVELQGKRRAKRSKLREWERDHWDAVALRAKEAAHRNDTRELYDIFKELRERGGRRNKDGGRNTVPDPEADREAWKDTSKRCLKGGET